MKFFKLPITIALFFIVYAELCLGANAASAAVTAVTAVAGTPGAVSSVSGGRGVAGIPGKPKNSRGVIRKRSPQSNPDLEKQAVQYGSLSRPRLADGEKYETIKGLSFVNSNDVTIQKENQFVEKSREVAKIIGRFTKEGGRVLTTPDYPNALAWTGAAGLNEFTLTLPVLAERSIFRLKAVDSNGNVENQIVILTYRKNVKPMSNPQWAGLKPTLSLGVVLFNYNEYYTIAPTTFSLSELLSTIKFSYDIRKGPWDLGLAALYTPFLISTTVQSYDFKLLSLDARIGYKIPIVSPPWRLSFTLGLIYDVMIVPTSYFGYKALGPQITGMLQKIMPWRDTLYAYLKYTPFPSPSFTFDLENREFRIGLGLLRPLGNRHPVSINLELASFLGTLNVVYQNISDTHFLHSLTYSVSASYGF